MSDNVELSSQVLALPAPTTLVPTTPVPASPELPTLDEVLHGRGVIWDITTPANSSLEIPDTPVDYSASLREDPQYSVSEVGFSFSPSLRRPQTPEFSNSILNLQYKTLS